MNNTILEQFFADIIEEARRLRSDKPMVDLSKTKEGAPRSFKREVAKGYKDENERLKGKVPVRGFEGTSVASQRLAQKPRAGEAEAILNIGPKERAIIDKVPRLLSVYEKTYEDADNVEGLKMAVKQQDATWRHFYGNLVSMVRTGGKMAFLNLLKKSTGVFVPVSFNKEGQPVYKFHNIHIFFQLKALENLLAAGRITPQKAETIKNTVIFNEAIRQSMAAEIEAYEKESKIKMSPNDVSDVTVTRKPESKLPQPTYGPTAKEQPDLEEVGP